MKICKVKPVINDSYDNTYELLQIGTSFWSGDYAMVQKDGRIQKVSLSQIYDVREM